MEAVPLNASSASFLLPRFLGPQSVGLCRTMLRMGLSWSVSPLWKLPQAHIGACFGGPLDHSKSSLDDSAGQPAH